jgi:hypothetical protein
MELVQLVRLVKGFDALGQPERIALLAWYLHTHRKMERFDKPDIRSCYDKLGIPCPDLSIYFRRLTEERSPAVFLKDKQGYRLAGTVQRQYDQKYGRHETVVIVSDILKELPGNVADKAERLFLTEALTCYEHQAFRAAIVMTWNLAYDHLLRWIVGDAQRLAEFNTAIPRKYPKKAGLVIADREGFEELREFEVIEVCGTACLFSTNNVKKILLDKLTKRNMAAHPSLVEITRHQADDTITDLVHNVVLRLV